MNLQVSTYLAKINTKIKNKKIMVTWCIVFGFGHAIPS